MVRHVHADEVRHDAGLVAAPDERIAEAGAEALRRGGNAVDAAVGAAFACTVIEPFMSGVGGATWMTIALPDPEVLTTVDGSMETPGAARPDMFTLVDPDGADGPSSAYEWPLVENFANYVTGSAVTVPGTVAALCEAQERFGRLPLAEVLEPAIRLAADGIEVNWYFAAITANEASLLRRDPGCAEVFMPRGLPLRGPGWRPAQRLVQAELAETLVKIGHEGRDGFYAGPVAESIVGTVRELGGVLSTDDMAQYRAAVSPPVTVAGRSVAAHGPPMSGVPTVAQAVHLYRAAHGHDPGAGERAEAWARAFRLAIDDRLRYLTRAAGEEAAWDGIMAPDYVQALVRADADRATLPSPPGVADEERVAVGAEDTGPSSHTTHLSVVDRDGGMVSLTQTVLSLFGAHVLDPGTGVTLNNGMAYYDPRPGTVNEIRPRVRNLTNSSPLVLTEGARATAAFGASGGRRIVSGVAQMLAALDDGATSMQAVIEEPRIHAEQQLVTLDARWGDGAEERLRDAGYRVEVVEEGPLTWHFARPNGVLVGEGGVRVGGVDPHKPGGVAAE